MKNFVLGIWMLFALQTFLLYVQVQKEVGSFMTRDMSERCNVVGEMNWSLLRAKFSLECEPENV
jgi:hypothetical protein